jgi:hypothetical protein
MTVAIAAIVARQQPVEGGHEIVVRAGADLSHDDARGRVRHEDVEQAVGVRPDLGDEARAGRRQVEESPARPGPDGQLALVYGKIDRRASRSRPRLPNAGADSKRIGSPAPTVAAPHWRRPMPVL